MLGQGVRRWSEGVALVAGLLLLASVARGSPEYSGCAECHGNFNGTQYTSLVDGAVWTRNLMNTHVDWVSGQCTACHMQEGPGDVYLADSGSRIFTNGCVGCHGREADVTGECTGLSNNASATQHCGSGAGLRQVHERRLGEGTCTSCHASDPTPAGEDAPAWNHAIVNSAIRNACDEDGSESRFGAFGLDNDGDGRRDANDPDCSFPINAGLNDAWFNPDTNGQGFLLTVLEPSKLVFLAWFTYSVDLPPEDAAATVGHPGHRWLIAQGPFDGDTAVMDVLNSSGGRFDSPDPVVGPPTRVGELVIQWEDCRNATLSYQIDGVGERTFPIRRISDDNVPLCEMLVEAGAAE